MKISWDIEADCIRVKFNDGKEMKFSKEFLEDYSMSAFQEAAKNYYSRVLESKHLLNSDLVDKKHYDNISAAMKDYYSQTAGASQVNEILVNNLRNENTNKMLNQQLYSSLAQSALEMPKINTNILRRLTTSGDWTIAVTRENKLVAFDSIGQTIVAVGSLLSADGKAWMLKDGYLWSGVLEHTETEDQARQRKIRDERKKVYDKYDAKIRKLEDKTERLRIEKSNELNSVSL